MPSAKRQPKPKRQAEVEIAAGAQVEGPLGPDTPLGMAPVTQATYVNARASAHQQQIFNVASSHVRAGGTNPVVTPSPETVSRQTTAAVDFYQSYLNTFSGRPIGGPQDEGH